MTLANSLTPYYKNKIYESDPFARLDKNSVGQLVKMAVEKGRSVRPDLKCGICSEHGGDPSSIEFCHQAGLDYVSCSPFRVPYCKTCSSTGCTDISRVDSHVRVPILIWMKLRKKLKRQQERQ